MADAHRLADIESIKQLKARYLHLLDAKAWSEWSSLFAEDFVMEVADDFAGAGTMRGRDVAVASIRNWLGDTVTIHHAHNPVIEFMEDGRARGLWSFEDRLYRSDGGRSHGFGHYHDEYRKSGGRWLIAATRVTRLRLVRVRPGADPAAPSA